MKPKNLIREVSIEIMEYEIIDRLHVKDKDGFYVCDGTEWDPLTNANHLELVRDKVIDLEIPIEYYLDKRDGKTITLCLPNVEYPDNLIRK